MAMTKKELAEMDRLREDLVLARAMRWPSYPKPAPMTDDEIKANLADGGEKWGVPQQVARGWFYNAYLGSHYPPRATYGCSNGVFHSPEGDTTTSQQTGRMYKTEAEALQALRIDLTEQAARLLAKVDQLIQDAS